MLGTQRESVRINESRYRNGLQKLEETKVMVNELQVGATALKRDSKQRNSWQYSRRHRIVTFSNNRYYVYRIFIRLALPYVMRPG